MTPDIEIFEAYDVREAGIGGVELRRDGEVVGYWSGTPSMANLVRTALADVAKRAMPEPEIVRLDVYNVSVNGVTIRATSEQERKLRLMTPERVSVVVNILKE